MTTKRTWRFQTVAADAARAMRTAPNLSAAARLCGVDRTTLHRWVKAGKLPPLTGRQPVRLPGAPSQHGDESTPAAWGASVRQAYDLNATEAELVSLAEAALLLAHDTTLKPADRLGAMARFAQLVRQINLEVPADGQAETTTATGTGRTWPRRAGS